MLAVAILGGMIGREERVRASPLDRSWRRRRRRRRGGGSVRPRSSLFFVFFSPFQGGENHLQKMFFSKSRPRRVFTLFRKKRMLSLSRLGAMRLASFSSCSFSAVAKPASPHTPAPWRDVRAMSTSTEVESGGRERRGGGNRGGGSGRGGGGRRSPSSSSSSASTSNPSSGFISLPPPSEAAISALTASAAEHNIPVVVLKGGRSKIFRGEWSALRSGQKIGPFPLLFFFSFPRRERQAAQQKAPRMASYSSFPSLTSSSVSSPATK